MNKLGCALMGIPLLAWTALIVFNSIVKHGILITAITAAVTVVGILCMFAGWLLMGKPKGE